jgi:hypothetical protein
MAFQGDCTVSLVLADSKELFQEHVKDGKLNVEVEPDAEFFISVERTGNTIAKTLLVKYFVDEQDLGYQTRYKHGAENKKC